MSPRSNSSDDVVRNLREVADTATVTDAALRTFLERYPDVKLGKLTVVIAAYNEADNIGPVLEEIPDAIAGIPTTTLVVDDGSKDDTATLAEKHGAYVCQLSVNRGHGVAVRLGYRIARENGADYIATLDADGQWDPADLPAMVEILEDDRADFVLGSRQLGRTENTDKLRNLGVRFFAKMISVLTGTKVTDSSSGLRAMRADLTGVVRQTQPQYQSSELLIGAVYSGYRIAEVPTVMRKRISGESKKGRNLSYGFRYTRVILSTWLRERKHADRNAARAARAGR